MGHRTPSRPFPCSSLQHHLGPPQCHTTLCAGLSPVSLQTPFLAHVTPVPTKYLASPHSGFSLYVTFSELDVPPPALILLTSITALMLCCNYLLTCSCPICLEPLRPGTLSSLFTVLSPQHLRLCWTMGGSQCALVEGIKWSVPCIAKGSPAASHKLNSLWGECLVSLPRAGRQYCSACKPKPAACCSVAEIRWSLRDAAHLPFGASVPISLCDEDELKRPGEWLAFHCWQIQQFVNLCYHPGHSKNK